MGHVIEPPNPVDAYSFSKSFGVHLLPDYGPVCSVKRPVRTRMRGVVGAGGEKPPATRLCVCIICQQRPRALLLAHSSIRISKALWFLSNLDCGIFL